MSDEDEDQTRSPQQVDPEEVELPEVGSLVYMYVTHVQSPKNICMRNIDGDNDRTLIMMEDDLTDFVRDNGTVLTSVQVITVKSPPRWSRVLSSRATTFQPRRNFSSVKQESNRGAAFCAARSSRWRLHGYIFPYWLEVE